MCKKHMKKWFVLKKKIGVENYLYVKKKILICDISLIFWFQRPLNIVPEYKKNTTTNCFTDQKRIKKEDRVWSLAHEYKENRDIEFWS